MLIFFSIELIISTISCAIFLKKATNCNINCKRVLIYFLLIFIPIYLVLAYFDILSVLSLFTSYTFLLFTVEGLSKFRIIYLVAFFQSIVLAITSSVILIENFFVQEAIYKSIIDLIIAVGILLILVIIKKEYIYSKADNFLVFIPNGLKILIVISLYIISFFSVDLSYINKTEFSNQSWYYFLEFSFVLSLIAFCVIYPIFISNVTSKNYYKKISEIANEQSKKQFGYYQKLLEKDQLLREFKHDYKNQLIVLKAYLDKGDIVSAENYLANSFGFINEISYVQTGNYILDALVSDKRQSAVGIDIELKGLITAEFIEPIDICTIFGNALDNAIEACRQVKKHNKVIKIKIQENANTVHFCISNPVEKPVKIVNNRISTTKADKINHGLGLYSINKSVEKYNGSVNIECDNNVFSINILLVDIKKT